MITEQIVKQPMLLELLDILQLNKHLIQEFMYNLSGESEVFLKGPICKILSSGFFM